MWPYTDQEGSWLSTRAPLFAGNFAELSPAALKHYLDQAHAMRASAVAEALEHLLQQLGRAGAALVRLPGRLLGTNASDPRRPAAA